MDSGESLNRQVYRTARRRAKRGGAGVARGQRAYDPEVVECINNERGTSLSLDQKSAYIGTMKVSRSPQGPTGLIWWGMAGLLAVLISAGPVQGQGTGDPASPTSASATHTKKGGSSHTKTGPSNPDTSASRRH